MAPASISSFFRFLFLFCFLGLVTTDLYAQTSTNLPVNLLPDPAATGADSVEFGKIPFEGYDLTWVNGQNRQRTFPISNSFLTGSVLIDTYYNFNFARPKDNTQTISSTVGRTEEFTVNLASIGIESTYKNIIGRFWLQTGAMQTIIQDLDASTRRGRNVSNNNMKLIREATAGYHFNKWYGINVEMGIFMSYIGLESYLTQENWNYQRSLICEFTPFYFQGLRAQIYPTKKYKMEFWLMNGWQTYAKWNRGPSVGMSNYYRPNENLQLVANFYYGTDTREQRGRIRFQHDNSIVYRYVKARPRGINQMAASINTHYGFETGGTITSSIGILSPAPNASQTYMAGTSIANRIWFAQKMAAITLRGDYVTNPSRYLAFDPGVNANAVAEYAQTDNEGISQLNLAQATATLDIMPNDHFTFRLEYQHRYSSVPYYAGRNGTSSSTGYSDLPTEPAFIPDLRKYEDRITLSANIRL
jgi:hypothetical protein